MASKTFVADRNKFLIVRYMDGRTEQIHAPKLGEGSNDTAKTHVVFDPLRHKKISVRYYSISYSGDMDEDSLE